MASPIITQPATVDDFSGGMTENFIAEQANKFELAQNLFINDNRKLRSRFGSALDDVSNAQSPEGEFRIGSMFYLEDQLFQQSLTNLYFNDSGFNTLLGPTSNAAFVGNTATSYTAYAEWNRHMIATSDAYGSVQRIYKDGGGTFRCNNLGLPRITQANAIELANDLKAEYNAHIADATQHTAGADATNVITSPDATEFDSLVTLVTELLTDYDAHDDDAELGSSWAFHSGQENADHTPASVVAPETLDQCISRLDDLKAKFNAHDADSGAHALTTLHPTAVTSAPTVTPTVGNSKSYIYGFVLKFEYTIGDVTFVERGPVKLIEVTNGDDPSSNQHDVADIPTLVNGTTENFDTTNIKVEIYRTIVSGGALFYLGEVVNGTSTYTDVSSDSDIENNITLYTTGDVLDYDPPPKAKYVLSINDIIWYAGIKEGSVKRTNRIRHSNKSQPGACPESHVEDLDEEITALGAVNIFPIVFCKNKTFRLEGYYSTTGEGFIKKREISSTVGCISHNSVINVKDGLYFAGEDGFYFCDGFSVRRISEEINASYKLFTATATQRDRIYGTYDDINDRVLWATQSDITSFDNDTIYVGHLKYQTSSGVPFTHWNGGLAADNFQPSSIIFDDEEFLRADRRGYLFRHEEAELDDPKIDVITTPSAWEVRPIIFDYRSVATDFGITNIRKWVPKVVITMDNVSNISLQIESQNDNSGVFLELKPIRFRGNIEWGDQIVPWGPESDSIRWDYFPIIEQMRRFPAGGLRTSYKQIRLTNDYTIITSSDERGLATLDSAAKTVTLEDASEFDWDDDSVDYYVSFEADNYVNQHLITTRTADTITIEDPNNFMPNGSGIKWQQSGYKKSETFNLFSYVVEYAPLSKTQETYRGVTGENA